jgi:hypothetical protein
MAEADSVASAAPDSIGDVTIDAVKDEIEAARRASKARANLTAVQLDESLGLLKALSAKAKTQPADAIEDAIDIYYGVEQTRGAPTTAHRQKRECALADAQSYMRLICARVSENSRRVVLGILGGQQVPKSTYVSAISALMTAMAASTWDSALERQLVAAFQELAVEASTLREEWRSRAAAQREQRTRPPRAAVIRESAAEDRWPAK